MVSVKEELRWGSKKKLEDALKDWQKEDKHLYSELFETMRNLYDLEKI
jgi:hypothetical protein